MARRLVAGRGWWCRSVSVAAPALALMLAAGQARAQDSVAPASSSGLASDAVSAYQAGASSQQQLRYVVDMASKTSSWGNRYLLAPVVKASRDNLGVYFDNLIGPQAASSRFRTGAFPAGSDYALWTSTPGAGVNGLVNSAPTSTIPAAGQTGLQFALGFVDFGSGGDGLFGTLDDENNLISGVVNFASTNPRRLFVTRTVAASNRGGPALTSTASFGIGAVDSGGQISGVADGLLQTATGRLTSRLLFRVRPLSRNVANINQPFQLGSITWSDSGSIDQVRVNTTPMTAPASIESSLAGGAGRPVMLSTDLINNYIFESGANTTSTTNGYLNGVTGASPRGTLCFIPQVYAPVASGSQDIGTAATLVRTDSGTRTRGIQLFGVNTSGSLDSSFSITLPVTNNAVIDPTDNFSASTAFPPLLAQEFTNFSAGSSFRGGSSPLAMTVLPSGEIVIAALVAPVGGGSSNIPGMDNYIVVARMAAGGGFPSWTIAAHTGSTNPALNNNGKAVLGRASAGAPLTRIGRIARTNEVYPTAVAGPSLSGPALDRAGNVYFMAGVALDQPSGDPVFTTALVRANFTPATNAYQLEIIARVGDIVTGVNSGTPYQVQFLGVADGDGIDPGSIGASSIVQDTVGNMNLSTLPVDSPRTLGALVFRAKIVYDTDNDSTFRDPAGGIVSTSTDQAYNVAMVLMPSSVTGDFDGNGAVEVADIFAFLSAWFGGLPSADYDGNGTIEVADIFAFLSVWFQGV